MHRGVNKVRPFNKTMHRAVITVHHGVIAMHRDVITIARVDTTTL